MRVWRRIVFAFFLVAAAGLCSLAAYLGNRIAFSIQWPLFEALRNTSAIIFAVVGAWLAIIYPEQLKLTFRRKKQASDSSSGTPDMRLILTPAVSSAVILIVILAVGVLAPLAKQVPFALEYTALLRRATFLVLMVLTLWQIAIVVLAILPVDFLLTDEAERRAVRAVHDQYDGLAQKTDSNEEGSKP